MNWTQRTFFLSLFTFTLLAQSQTPDASQFSSHSVFKNVKIGDSIVFYQCHVETAKQELTTRSGQQIKGEEQTYSITEKFVITKQDSGYKLKYSQATLTIFPNKKFTGLKFKEKAYWKFNKASESNLSQDELKVFAAMEQKGRDAIVYDYAISKYSKNQIIIRYADDYKQLLIDGEYVISKLLKKN